MRWTGILTLMLTMTIAAQTPQRLTIEDAILIGQNKSKTLSLSAVKEEAASAKWDETNSRLLPAFKFTGGYTRLSDVPPYVIQPPGSTQVITLAPTILNSYALGVSLRQPIFTGFKLQANARAAEYLQQASESDHRNDKDDLTLNVIAAYWSMYQAQETRKFVDENVNRLQAYHKDTENLMRSGMATRNDLLKIEVQLSNAKLTQIDAANEVRVAMMNLNNLMGQPIEADIELASIPQEITPGDVGETPAKLVEQAYTRRADVQAMRSRIQAMKASVTAERGNYFPQIYLTGNYIYNRPNVRYQPISEEFKSTWDVGVQVQFDVWNWGMTSSQVEQAKAALSQNEILYDVMKDNIVLEVKRQEFALKRAKEKLVVAHLGIEQAEENARTTRDTYKNGLATSSEMLEADVALLQAKLNYTGALIERELANARLNRAVGK